ncbi:hypothetical protein [Lysobacter gummosus]
MRVVRYRAGNALVSEPRRAQALAARTGRPCRPAFTDAAAAR